ncbi:transcription factor Pcc1 [Ascodesmis nigricans]|uniref:Transcription factor Pcc1 n=1 Tax=Ascodesmis nigricans TaxID=341454 RepID=A0A4S2N7T8_9PEZI|nr:transcription factor Pcc1 [Ascodesmis nigricans]
MSAFPHVLTVNIPLPSPRLATILSESLSVDEELSPHVHRTFETDGSTLVVRYSATTARMLRVSTNGVFESIKTLLETFQELDEPL